MLANVTRRDKKQFTAFLKLIRPAPDQAAARQQSRNLIATYGKQYPKAIEPLEEGLDDSLTDYDFSSLAARTVSSNNMLKRSHEPQRTDSGGKRGLQAAKTE